MDVFVVVLTGKTVTVRVAADATVKALREAVMEVTHLPAVVVRLVANGVELTDDTATLAAVGVGKEAVLHIARPMRAVAATAEHGES